MGQIRLRLDVHDKHGRRKNDEMRELSILAGLEEFHCGYQDLSYDEFL